MKKTVSSSSSKASHWAESRHKDIIIYLLVAIFLLELAVEQNYIHADELATLREWRQSPDTWNR